MEDLLAQLVKEATGPKLMNLKNASQNAYGIIFCLFEKNTQYTYTHRQTDRHLYTSCLLAHLATRFNYCCK